MLYGLGRAAWALVALSAVNVLALGQAHATTVTFNFDFEFSTGTSPAGSTPWVTAIFDDNFGGPADTVRLTIDNSGLTGSEKNTGFYFNLDPALPDSSNLSFSFVGGSSTGPAATGITQSEDCCKPDGDGQHDVQFDFPTSGDVFGAGEKVVYDISGITGLAATLFNFKSTPKNINDMPLYAAAKIQSIGAGSASGWIAPTSSLVVVPLPAALWLFGGGLIGLVGVGRRQRDA